MYFNALPRFLLRLLLRIIGFIGEECRSLSILRLVESRKAERFESVNRGPDDFCFFT